jgi:hypothetical protein
MNQSLKQIFLNQVLIILQVGIAKYFLLTQVHNDRPQIPIEKDIVRLDVPVSQGLRLRRVHEQDALAHQQKEVEHFRFGEMIATGFSPAELIMKGASLRKKRIGMTTRNTISALPAS